MNYLLRELDMSLRDEIDSIKRESSNYSAASSFLSMYMWRNVYGTQIVCQDGFYALKLRGEDNTWFFPTGENEAKKAFIEDRLLSGNLRLLFATDEDANLINTYFADKIRVTEAADDSEYLYDVNGFKNLRGKEYSLHRRKVNNLNSSYNLQTEEVKSDNIHYIKSILENAWGGRKKSGYLMTNGNEIDTSIFDNISDNGIWGVFTLDGGKPVATVVGSFYTDSIFDIMVAECDHSYDNLLLYCMHAAARELNPKVQYMNMEEDLGIEGLRTWKQRINPVKMIDMWECNQI